MKTGTFSGPGRRLPLLLITLLLLVTLLLLITLPGRLSAEARPMGMAENGTRRAGYPTNHPKIKKVIDLIIKT